MMKHILVCAVLFAICCSVSAEATENVVTLTSENFDSVIADNEFVLVEFYAPWCGHCKSLAPEYEKAATTLKGGNIVIAKVDATVESELAQKFQIRGFPTLKFFINGDAQEYTGGRTEETIISWLKKRTGPASTLLTAEDNLKDFTSSSTSTFVAFVDEDSEEFKTYTSVARGFDTFSFAHVTSKDLAASLGLELNQVKLVRSFDDSVVVSITSDDELKTWIKKEAYPVFEEISQESYTRHMQSGHPFGILWIDASKEDADTVKEWAGALAKKFKGKFGLAWGDVNKFRGAVSALGASGTVIPTITAMRPQEDESQRPEQFAYDEETEFSEEGANSFIESIVDGTIVPWKKSQPIPENNDGPVTVVVYKNFNDVVFQEKDVLLEVYAPWCHHCQQLEPKYEALGKKLQDVEGVVIAKFDGTANAAPEGLEVEGFPTLKFFPATAKSVKDAVDFDEDRSVKGLLSFLKKHAVTDLSGVEYTEEDAKFDEEDEDEDIDWEWEEEEDEAEEDEEEEEEEEEGDEEEVGEEGEENEVVEVEVSDDDDDDDDDDKKKGRNVKDEL